MDTIAGLSEKTCPWCEPPVIRRVITEHLAGGRTKQDRQANVKNAMMDLCVAGIPGVFSVKAIVDANKDQLPGQCCYDRKTAKHEVNFAVGIIRKQEANFAIEAHRQMILYEEAKRFASGTSTKTRDEIEAFAKWTDSGAIAESSHLDGFHHLKNNLGVKKRELCTTENACCNPKHVVNISRKICQAPRSRVPYTHNPKCIR